MNTVIRATRAGLLGVVLAAVGATLGCGSHGHSHGEHDDHDDHHDGHGHDAQPAEADHGHGHGTDAIGITRWTERLELFAEHAPAIAGHELAFVAHITILDDFQALEHATVTLLLVGPERVEARVTQPLRPGIFQPTLNAPAAGTYRARLVVTGPQIQDTIDGFDIVVYANADAATHAAAPSKATGSKPIGFLKEQQWQVPFSTALAIQGSVARSVEVSGEVTTAPSGQADVGAPVAGRLVAPKGGLLWPGQSVQAGQLLASIAPVPSTPESAAGANLAVVEARARVESARAAFDRAQRLFADRALSQRKLEDARRELGVAKQAVAAARRADKVFSGAASGRGAGTYRITAPIDGVVVEVLATAGRSVARGESLLRIVNLDQQWIRAHVPEQEAAWLRGDQDASVLLPGDDLSLGRGTWLALDITGEDATASVVTIGQTVDRVSRTVAVIYALAHPHKRLRIGATVRVAVPTGEPWQGVVVPRSAVLEDNGRSVVYVQVEGESFEERAVAIGVRSGALVGLERGVGPDERVVTRGANVIRLSARASTTPAHGHVH